MISGGCYGTTSLGIKRRINTDGMKMFENNLAIRQTELKASMLENRLKHLENEELKALRNREKVEK